MDVEKIINKLGLDKRSCLFILDNVSLCDRILNESPIRVNDAISKYGLSEYRVKEDIKNNLLSSFSNVDRKGSPIFIFENEILELYGKNTYNITGKELAFIINNTIELYMVLIRPLLTTTEYNIVQSVIINKKSINITAKQYDLSNSRINELLRKAMYKVRKYINRLATYDQLLLNIGELENKSLPITNISYNRSILDCNFSVRAINVLKSMGIVNLGQLTKFSITDLHKYRNMGKKTIDNIIMVLDKYGLNLSK